MGFEISCTVIPSVLFRLPDFRIIGIINQEKQKGRKISPCPPIAYDSIMLMLIDKGSTPGALIRSRGRVRLYPSLR